jgi:hypothetical protein
LVRKIVAALALICLLVVGSKVLSQSPTASITGIVFDPDNKVIPGAEIIVVNDVTRAQYETKTNGEGIYTVVSLPPGPYRIQVSKSDFKTIIKPDIILNVGDALSLNFTLPVGASSVSVTVEGGAPIRRKHAVERPEFPRSDSLGAWRGDKQSAGAGLHWIERRI